MIKKQLLLVYLLLITIAGCAVNDKGLMKLQYFENETSYLRLQKSWGGYLSMRHVDRGLVLGHTDRIMIYPKLRNKNNLTIEEFFRQVDNDDFVEIGVKDIDTKNMQPFAWVEKNKGIMFHANPLKIGLSAGIESRSILRLPVDFEGIFVIKQYEDGSVKVGAQESIQKK